MLTFGRLRKVCTYVERYRQIYRIYEIDLYASLSIKQVFIQVYENTKHTKKNCVQEGKYHLVRIHRFTEGAMCV